MGRFTGKVAVITGAGGGIGRAVAARLASEGASLVLVDRVADTLKHTYVAAERAGAAALAVEADVTRWDDVQRYTTAAAERFGGIDLFFNNAGILGDVGPLIECSEATFDRVLAVNVKGVWLGLKAVAPAMIARGGGAIVNTASVAGCGPRRCSAPTRPASTRWLASRAPPPSSSHAAGSASTPCARRRSTRRWCDSSRPRWARAGTSGCSRGFRCSASATPTKSPRWSCSF